MQYDLNGFSATDSEAAYIFRFTSLAGEQLAVEVPADNFLAVFPQCHQLWLAASLRKQGGEPSKRGDWQKTPVVEATKADVCSVSMESQPAVAIVFDRDLATQIGFQFSPEIARQLAAQLLEKAEQSSRVSTKH